MTPEDLRSHPGQSPKERAEKIMGILSNYGLEPRGWKLRDMIAAEIRAAVEDHKREYRYNQNQMDYAIRSAVEEAWGKDDLDHFARVKRQAERDAYADAARIAEPCQTGVGAAFNIRARAAEVSKLPPATLHSGGANEKDGEVSNPTCYKCQSGWCQEHRVAGNPGEAGL